MSVFEHLLTLGSFVLASWVEGGQVKVDTSTAQGGESEAPRHD